MRDEQREKDRKITEHAAESLTGPDDFCDGSDLDQKNFRYEKEEGCLFKKNVDSSRWSEPRMVTMKQMRNVVFSVMNQSKFTIDLNKVITKADQLHNTTVKLNEADLQLNHKFTEEINKMNDWFKKYQQEQKETIQAIRTKAQNTHMDVAKL